MGTRHDTLSWLGALVVVVALGVGGAISWHAVNVRNVRLEALGADLAKARTDIQALTDQRDTALEELDAALRINARLSARVDALGNDLAQARQTRLEVREIRGTADFPIQRAMAREGDTVVGFARREGTTEAVVRALNPWLDGTETLESWQTLWVPKPR